MAAVNVGDDQLYEANGDLAREVANVVPYFPYKKIDRFYDVQGKQCLNHGGSAMRVWLKGTGWLGGLLMHPALFGKLCKAIAARYRQLGITKMIGFEARGFLFTQVAVELGVPFIMARKQGKMPNTISSAPYTKEYAGVDVMCIQRGAVGPGDKVLLMDDLIATGGTLCSGIELVKSCGAEVTECCCMVELKALRGRDRCLAAGAKSVWGFISEELLIIKAKLPDDYVDDGAAH